MAYIFAKSLPIDQVMNKVFQKLSNSLAQKEITAAVIGLGYVGLPLSYTIFSRNIPVIGLDIDPAKVEMLKAGRTYLGSVDSQNIQKAVSEGLFRPETDFTALKEADFIVICVPTPLGRDNEPDLSYVENTVKAVSRYMRPGQVVILESTSYPGTMRDVVLPILESESGLVNERDFHIAYSPEREDPGNEQFNTGTIPKIVGAGNEEALNLAVEFYRLFIQDVVPVSSMEVAEAAKITENIFRAVNIAFVNELKVIYDRMGIDVWEVIEAAKTKPFGYMPFYPGPGIGGHCIPIDPLYLSWKAEQLGQKTRFIELAGEINLSMKDYIIGKIEEALGCSSGQSLQGVNALVIGVAYKKNIGDQRESPALPLIEALVNRSATVDFHDPYVSRLTQMRDYPEFADKGSVDLDPECIADYDAVVIVTDHDTIDYGLIAEKSRVIIDTRNALRSRGIVAKGKVVRA